jgi:hypothetical protein
MEDERSVYYRTATGGVIAVSVGESRVEIDFSPTTARMSTAVSPVDLTGPVELLKDEAQGFILQISPASAARAQPENPGASFREAGAVDDSTKKTDDTPVV